MRRLLVFVALTVLPLACASIIGFPDVPSLTDAGVMGDGPRGRPGSDSTPLETSGPRSDGGDAGGKDGGRETGRLDAATEAATDGRGSSDSPVPISCNGFSLCHPGDNCCKSLPVDGGEYFRTYDLANPSTPQSGPDGAAIGEADPAKVSAFKLDEYLVTVGRFRRFGAAWNADGAGYRPAAGSGKHSHLHGGDGLVDVGSDASGFEPGWMATDDMNVSPGPALSCTGPSTWGSTDDTVPINCVTWAEAYAFCIWDGGFLPSEAEWEYAAAGGNEQREYPWGSTDAGTAHLFAIYGCTYPTFPGLCSPPSNLAPVGTPTLGAARWGQRDMAGELYEWTLDWFASYVTPCADCANLTLTTLGQRVIRGGFYDSLADQLIPSYRYSGGGLSPTTRLAVVGFRCARAP